MTQPNHDVSSPAAPGPNPHAAQRTIPILSSLLADVHELACADCSPEARRDIAYQNCLAETRLGLASALFVALRAKHAPTAAHSLRVALTCSVWSHVVGLGPSDRDALEVAALLHDVGKIGVPDRVLLKPAELSTEEKRVMHRHREYARDILTMCCASQDVLDIVYYAAAWYSGHKPDFDRQAEDLPRGARMLAIVDAYDAMTTEHVYRRAMPRDRAMAELSEHAGTQFDPRLLRNFSDFLNSNADHLRSAVVGHWLQELRGREANAFWQLQSAPSRQTPAEFSQLFHEQLLEHLHASVVFVDRECRILKWTHECETLTGLPAASVEGLRWEPALIQLRDEDHALIPSERCPVNTAIQTGNGQRLRLVVTTAQAEKVAVDAQVAPVRGADGEICGATLLMFDASSQVALERQVESLHERASQDGLTRVGNRAEFDRRHVAWVHLHHENRRPYSMIICDLDYFKRINDTFGHQAGDEALVSFAALLNKFCRSGDLVSRYGGEEFVVLCPNCDRETARTRAEAIREAWAAKPHPALGGKCLTCSFGVTELQAGDTAETMLRRADRALLQAKDSGRNAVVQLGCGAGTTAAVKSWRRGWLSWLRRSPIEPRLQRHLITASPLKVTAEKLRGFVADQAAEIVSMDENRLSLQIEDAIPGPGRRGGDRATPYLLEIEFQEIQVPSDRREEASDTRTLCQVAIRPKRERDRRRDTTEERARQLLVSLKAYLMAQDYVCSDGDRQRQGVVSDSAPMTADLSVSG